MRRAARAGRWSVEYLSGTANDIHARELPADPVPTAWVIEPTGPAIVLGSAQRETDVDTAAARSLGFDVVRRRSGGGAVVVVPGELAWIDVIVPAGDALWDDDITRASYWLGDAWAEVVGSYGHVARVHRGAFRSDELARTFCFAGVGPGEVLIGDHKVVGISQRRTRHAARFQCACILDWNPEPALAVLPGLEPKQRRVVATGAGLGDGLSRAVLPGEVTDRFIEALATY